MAPTMPVTETVDVQNRLVHTVATGLVTRDEFMAHIERTWTDGQFSDCDEIVDAMSADASQLSHEDVIAIINSGVEFDGEEMPKLALCVNSDLEYGIGRMFGTMRELHDKNSREIQVFCDLESAEAWIGKRIG